MLEYHRHLDEIAAADIAYVRRKDAQYNASWKRRGGQGAFFTIARPWDRLENIASAGAYLGVDGGSRLGASAYDIFEIIGAEGLAGPDGSLIACVRDLRRYLLLLEAEMTESLLEKCKEHNAKQDSLLNLDLSELERRVLANDTEPRRDQHTERAQREGISRQVAKAKSFSEVYGAGTPEDGGHHDRDVQPDNYPWVATWGQVVRSGVIDHESLWDKVAQDAFRLRHRLTNEEWRGIPDRTLCMNDKLYEPVYTAVGREQPHSDERSVEYDSETSWWLRIDRCPAGERDRWPRYPVELNHKEYEDLMEWRELYSWDPMQDKWIMREKWRGWSREP